MRMIRNGALAAGAMVAMAFLGACSDSATAPTSRGAFVPKSSFAVGATTTSTPVVGVLKICKLGNVGGSFTITDKSDGEGGTGNPSIATNPLAVAAGECRIAAEDNGDSQLLKGDFFGVSENAAADPANTVQALTSCVGVEGVIACNDNYFVNNVHGVVLTYTNTFTPPPPGRCTYTKGWYRNKGASTITGVDGLSIQVEGAFFAATPKNTGSVSFVGSNDLLNLYQQLLAALENGGAAGPAAVQTAITTAQNGTTVTGTVLTTTLTQAQISALIVTLSSFNEGSLTGFPHCGDEILVS
jgi:hypothetical protein